MAFTEIQTYDLVFAEPLDHDYFIVFVINTVSLKAGVHILQAHPMTW